jgi:hypothetical protein
VRAHGGATGCASVRITVVRASAHEVMALGCRFDLFAIRQLVALLRTSYLFEVAGRLPSPE